MYICVVHMFRACGGQKVGFDGLELELLSCGYWKQNVGPWQELSAPNY